MMLKIFLSVLLVALTACTAGSVEQPNPQPYPAAGEGETDEPYPAPIEVEPPIVYPGPEEPASEPPVYTPSEPSEFAPQPEDVDLARGEVFLQVANSELLILESYPVQIKAILRGELPDPCHKLRVLVNPPDAQNNIQVEVYTLIDSSQVCAAVIEPFEATISLGSFAGGRYSVTVNGEKLGEFDA